MFYPAKKLILLSLSDCNGTRSHNHLFRKRALNHLAKLVSTGYVGLLLLQFREKSQNNTEFFLVRVFLYSD